MKPKDLPCICIRLRRSSQALTALYNQALEANGLTISQYQLMEKITKNPGCSTSQIANQVHLERSTLARNLSRLAAEGMIMDASLKGKRNSQWHLTQQGKDALEQAQEGWQRAQTRVYEEIGEEKMETFLEVMSQLQNIGEQEEVK